MAKTTIKLKDLAQMTHRVDVSDTEQILIRALNLREMVELLFESRDTFLALYAAALDDGLNPATLTPILLTAPALVAKMIALASDEPESAAMVEKTMPATVQLIALQAIWKASVPDPKKAKELLSEVTVLLQKANEEAKKISEAQKKLSPTPSPVPLTS